MNNWNPAASALRSAVAAIAWLGGVASFSVAQADRHAAHPPIAARLSPSGSQVAFIVGDSLYVMGLADRRTRAVAGGVGFEARAARKQLVWSPDSRFLLFRRGSPPRMNYVVADAATGGMVEVLPDTLEGRLRTVGNVFTGPPVWSPDSDRIAFLGGRPDDFGALTVVYVATRQARGSWTLRLLASDGVEKTALAWSRAHLAYASRDRDGRTVVTIAPVSGDSIGPGMAVPGGDGRITGLLPAPDGGRFLVTHLSAAPQIVDTRLARITRPDLPPETSLDSYLGWVNDRLLLAFRYPSDWRSELVTVDVAGGDARPVLAIEGRFMDGTLAPAATGVQVVLGEEHGSQPRSYRSVLVTPGQTVTDVGDVTPPQFASRPDPWATRIASWRAEDGSMLEAQLLIPPSPPDVVPPTVVVPYGGYRNTALTHMYFLDVLLRELLADGWQVIRPNTRASNVLQQQFGYGAVQLSDTHGLIDALAGQGLLDPGRVAVVGHSHGASLAYYYATHSPGFCAVVAVNGRADWVMQAEYDADGLLPRVMGASPREDPALYAAASPLPNAHAVTAPMLLVAGANDGQILPVNATAMADSLRAYSRPFDLMLFNDEGHLIDSEPNRRELIRRSRGTLAACRNQPVR